MGKKGWIALDIDGTITLDRYSVPEAVSDYLRELSGSWNIVLATGRAFCFAKMALEHFDFPFILLPQNGSVALEMPAQKPLFKRYLSREQVALVEQAYEGLETDFLLYGGYDKGDLCYWRPGRFSSKDLLYLKGVQEREKEGWKEVSSFESLEQSAFPLIKCFGLPQPMKRLQERLASGPFETSWVRDPFHEEYFLLLVTDRTASKGSSLKELFRLKGRGSCIIAAGDDENDLSLLEAADVKIAMAHAPISLQRAATFIAPPTKDCGIIHALQMAIRTKRYPRPSPWRASHYRRRG